MQYQHLPVNWIDGMKINQSHFVSQHNAFSSQLAYGISGLLNDCSYGLLPDLLNGSSGIKLFVSADNQQQLHARIVKCMAVSLGGHPIQVEEDADDLVLTTPLPVLSLSGNHPGYFVVLTVNPYERVPCGFANPEEAPFRLPFTSPLYSLGLVPAFETDSNAFGLFQLPIGRLYVREQKMVPDDNYIPPCCTVSSCTALLEAHASLEQFLSKTALCALQIIQKIMQKKQQNDIAAMVHKVCEQLVFFCAQAAAPFNTTGRFQPPVYLVNTFSAMARLVSNTLDCYQGAGKEELLNYCTECCQVTQAQLEGVIMGLTHHRYSHVNTGDALKKVYGFTQLIDHLLAGLLKQEYVGRYKDWGFCVNEQIVPAETGILQKTRISLLAD